MARTASPNPTSRRLPCRAFPATLTASTIQRCCGPSLLAAAALPYLASTKGTIGNVSSTFGHKPAAGLSHYAASKDALEHLARCWALELAPRGIRVNTVAAGPTELGPLTGMRGLFPAQAVAIKEQERERIPLKHRGDPEDAFRWIMQLADTSDARERRIANKASCVPPQPL